MKWPWVGLTLAFDLVILVAVGTVALLAALTAGQVLRFYLAYREMLAHQPLVEQMAGFHRRQGSWQGVEVELEQAAAMPDPMIGMRRDTRRPLPPRTGPQLVLADANGRVILDRLEWHPAAG